MSSTFQFSVAKQLAPLEKADREEGWGLGKPVLERLERTAPAWPEGRLCLRSLRIRFGSGWRGVEQTFETHVARIAKVFRKVGFYRNPCVQSGRKRLQLLAGDKTHRPTVEWVTFDLDAHRNRQSIAAIRSTSSIADELYAMAWLFPEVIRSINFREVPGFFAGGYAMAVPGLSQNGPWASVPVMSLGGHTHRVNLEFEPKTNKYSDCSVPTLLAA